MHWDCIAFDKLSHAMHWNALELNCISISIVVQCIGQCIGIKLLMISIVVQCIGQNIGIKLLMTSIVVQCNGIALLMIA